MTKRESLIENYENACFALIIDGVTCHEGKQLIKENEALTEDPEAAVSESFIKQCIDTIKRAFSKNKRHDAARIGFKVFNRVAVAAVVMIILFTSAYAAFPEVRIRTLNLLIEISDVSASLTLVDEGEGSSVPEDRLAGSDGRVLMGYHIPEMPEGFAVVDEGSDKFSSWINCEDEFGNWILVSIIKAEYHNVDTEESDYVQDLTINGFDALQIRKDGRIHIAWGDTSQECFIELIALGIDDATAIALAQQIYFVEK